MSKARPLCALVLLAACSESPSYALRWRITAADGTSAPLTSIKQCTEVGIDRVRVHTRQGGIPIDVRDLPCFPDAFADPEAAIDGPELEPGTYDVLLEGLRRGGGTWEGVMSAERAITVQAGASLLVDDLRIPAPPSCDDGVDNDLDGTVDGADAGCGLDPPDEGNDINSAQFFVRPSFFGDLPAVECGDVDVDAFEVVVHGVQGGVPFDAPPERFACGVSSYGFRLLLDPNYDPITDTMIGPAYSVDVAAVRTVDGINYTTAATLMATPFTVAANQGNYVTIDADFPAASFSPPIVAPFALVVAAEPFTGGEPRGCAPGLYGGQLTVDTVKIAVVDAEGQMVDGVTLEGGEALDGETALPCPTAALRTAPLEWGEHQLLITAGVGDEVCFANAEPIRAAPGSTIAVTLPRTSSAGACADCSVEGECAETMTCSAEGVCLPP